MMKYFGSCDVSAAARISDTDMFVAASDEEYWLRTYRLSHPGPPLTQLNVRDFLEPEDRDEEPDIEGAAQIGDRVYWIGSHGRDKDREEQESRRRLFATTVNATGQSVTLQPFGHPYKRLLSDLCEAPTLASFDLSDAAERIPQERNGLNIEGLAATPDGQLLIGFRNPIPHGNALIVLLENPATIVENRSVRAAFGRPILLPLGNRGIRALEYHPQSGTYWIIAGAFDDQRNFALFRWSGHIEESPKVIATPMFEGLKPEELIVIDGQNPEELTIQVFSDDGDVPMGEAGCKKLKPPSARAFRSIELSVPK